MSDDKARFLKQLVEQHGPSLERFLARKLENQADAAEVAQEAFLRIYRLEHPEELDNARAFLFQVASNLAIDQLRRRSLHFRFLKAETRELGTPEGTEITAEVASPEKILGAREKLARIYQVVDALPEKPARPLFCTAPPACPTAILRRNWVCPSPVSRNTFWRP